MRNIICITAMKRTEPFCPEKAVKFSAIVSLDKSPDENESILKDVSETPEGVKVMKFSDFEPRKAVQEYETILHADLQIQRDQHLKRLDDDNISGGPSDPKRLFTSVDSSNNNNENTSNGMGVSFSRLSFLLIYLFILQPLH
jgi:hypothetical protein